MSIDSPGEFAKGAAGAYGYAADGYLTLAAAEFQ
jgi:hypothetical protein